MLKANNNNSIKSRVSHCVGITCSWTCPPSRGGTKLFFICLMLPPVGTSQALHPKQVLGNPVWMSEAMNPVLPRGGWHMSTTLWTGFRQWFNNILSLHLQPPPPLIMQSDWIPLKTFSQLEEKTGICHLSASILLPVSLQQIFQSEAFACC